MGGQRVHGLLTLPAQALENAASRGVGQGGEELLVGDDLHCIHIPLVMDYQ